MVNLINYNDSITYKIDLNKKILMNQINELVSSCYEHLEYQQDNLIDFYYSHISPSYLSLKYNYLAKNHYIKQLDKFDIIMLIYSLGLIFVLTVVMGRLIKCFCKFLYIRCSYRYWKMWVLNSELV